MAFCVTISKYSPSGEKQESLFNCKLPLIKMLIDYLSVFYLCGKR